jgi:hypothetical protein
MQGRLAALGAELAALPDPEPPDPQLPGPQPLDSPRPSVAS